jgi:hypothetical protein
VVAATQAFLAYLTENAAGRSAAGLGSRARAVNLVCRMPGAAEGGRRLGR